MAIGELASGVRLHVYESFVARGHPPTMQEMADKSGAPAHEVIRALVHLEQSRALILNPARDRVVVAPPFSAIPTPFWVETSAGSWWGSTKGPPDMTSRRAASSTWGKRGASPRTGSRDG